MQLSARYRRSCIINREFNKGGIKIGERRIGIVACASMQEQIKDCMASLEQSFNIYPVIPACEFNVKIDSFRYYLNKSTAENDITIFAYGLCHPQFMELITEYSDSVIWLRGSNCFEMFLGKTKYAEYHRKCYLMVNKTLFTKYKKALLAEFAPSINNYKLLIGDTFKKLVYMKFKNDQLDTDLVKDFANTMELDYEIHLTDTENLKRLLEEALATIPPIKRTKLLEPFPKFLKKSEAQTIFGMIDEIIYKMDINTRRFAYISPNVKANLGYNPAEFIDIINDDVKVPLYHEDDRDHVLAVRGNFIDKCLDEGIQEPYEIEYRMKHKNGNVLWVMESISPNYNSEGTIESFVGKIADITKRKKMENALKDSEFYKDIFIHDMNNILHSILLGTQLSLLNLGDTIKFKDLKSNLKIVEDQIRRGEKLISNISKISQLEEIKISIKQIEIFSILQATITSVKNAFQDRIINIQIDSISKKLFVFANEFFNDVVENLLTNAVKYNRNPTVELIIRISEVQREKINYLKIEFIDNGIGIEDIKKENIFLKGRFKDVSVHGMGMGLSLVKKIIETYDGKIWVEDRVKGDYSKGSNFIMLIPKVV